MLILFAICFTLGFITVIVYNTHVKANLPKATDQVIDQLFKRQHGQRVMVTLSNKKKTLMYRRRNKYGGWTYYDNNGYLIDDFVFGITFDSIINENFNWFSIGPGPYTNVEQLDHYDDNGNFITQNGVIIKSQLADKNDA